MGHEELYGLFSSSMPQPPQLLQICSYYVSTMDVKLKIALEQHVKLYVWSKTISSTMCVLYARL